ncbi:MAG: hypothetical protein V7K47_12265 [Nostoc sp.]
MKQQSKQQSVGKVVPFTGEFYPANEPAPAVNNTAAFLVILAAALLAGLSIGAISTYQSASQVQLRQMKADQAQLQDVKTQVCRQ